MRPLADDQKGINALALDAGSPGGVISQLHILVDFMKRLRTELNMKEDPLPSDHFHLIGGSGLAAFAALCIGPLKMSAEEALESLQVLGLSVFYEHHDQSRETIFDSTELRENLRNIIEGAGYSPDTMIGTLDAKSYSKSVFFVSPIVDIASCHRLRSYRGRKGMLQCTILEVALASISTLGLFDYAEIGSSRRKYTSVGMHHTNPIKDVLDEAEQIFGKEHRVATILSLGSGTGSDTIMPSNLAHLEVHGLLQAMEIQQKVVTEEVGRRYGGLEAYYRFSVERVGSGSLSDWTHWSANTVEEYSRTYLDDPKHGMKLASSARQLKESRGTVTLDSLNHASGATVIAKKVPPVTPFFVIRKKSWSFIEKNLANAPMDKQLIFLLTGLGGCGKSTLLSYYVQVYGSKYSHIFLVDASSVHSIKTDLQNVVRSLGPQHSQKSWEEALQYFEQDGPDKNWLIGFDSADDPSLPLHEFIPKSDHGAIFITSRNRDLFLLTAPELQWELGPMTAEEVLDALLCSAQRSASPTKADLQDGAALVEQLGGLALAVVQAGVYCFQRSGSVDAVDGSFSFRQYLEEMGRNHGDLMRYSATQSLDGYDKSVYQSLNMSYSALPQLTRDFLHLCGHFHHSNIPLLMFESAVDGRFQQTQYIVPPEVSPVIERKLADILASSGISTTIHLHKIIFTLKMFSLVVTSMTPNSIMLNYHALVSTWSRDLLSPKNQQQYSAMATRIVSTCADEKYYLVYPLLFSHIKEINQRYGNLRLNDMNAFARCLLKGGTAGDAETLYRQVYEQCVREFGRDDENTTIALGNLAYSICHQGRYEEAIEMGREVLAGKRTIDSEGHYPFFWPENNLALSYIQLNRWNEAETILLKLLSIVRKQESEPLRTLTVMTNLAIVYFGQKRHQESMELKEEVFKMHIRVLGKDHPDTLGSMTNLATSYNQLHRLDDAQRLQEEVLQLSKVTNGKDHPDTFLAMSNLANTYGKQGRLHDALLWEEQGLDGRKRVLGQNHPDTLTSMTNIADLYRQLYRVDEAQRLEEEVLEINRNINGRDHPSTLMAMHDLASTYVRQGRLNDALTLGEQVLEGFRRVLGKNHPNTLGAMTLVAKIYFKMYRLSEGIQLLEELRELEGGEGEWSERLVNSLHMLYQ